MDNKVAKPSEDSVKLFLPAYEEVETVSNASSSSSSSSNSTSNSYLENAFPNIEDWSSDYSFEEALFIESPIWNTSILDLFESFSNTTDTKLEATSATDDKLTSGCVRSSCSDRMQSATANPLEAVYEQYLSTNQPSAEESNMFSSDGSTFRLQETMVESSVTITDNEANLQIAEVLSSQDISKLEDSGKVENSHCLEAGRSDNETVVCSRESYREIIFAPSQNRSPRQSALIAEGCPETLAKRITTSERLSVSQVSDCLPDSGFHEDIDEIVDSSQPKEISSRHSETLDRIVEVLQQIEQSLNNGVPLTVRRKPSWQACTMENGILQSNHRSQQAEKVIKPIDCRRLQLMVRLLATIYQLIATGTICTKRELYYLHLDLAHSAYYTYAVLADVCALLDVDPWDVNVFNASKGLVAGALVLTLACGRTVDCNARWGTSVPLDVGSVVELQIDAKLVLVVEKDTVFKRLLEDGILDKFCNRLLLVTGKGYPDVSTRLLLKKIADCSNVPICGLMDADPHGIEIFCVYKFGSLAMAHRQQSLALSSMRWIGLFPSDIELLGLQGVQLRETEMRKIEHMSKRPYIEGTIQRELMFLRQLATKAEIESLYDIASDYVTMVYLTQKLKEFRLN